MNEPTVDPLADSQPQDDPFAEVPAEPEGAASPLPEGVTPGSLGGENPGEEGAEVTEEEAEAAESEDATGVPETEETEGEAESPEAEPEPEIEPEPAVEPEPEPDLGPEGEELEAPPEGSPDLSEPEPEPEAPLPPDAPEGSAKTKRDYTVLRLASDEGAADHSWDEVCEVHARSGEHALRAAYRQLTGGGGEGSETLVAVPSKLFKPRKVEGKVPQRALAIKVS